MTRKVVAVVDDDESVRESLPDLLKSFGFDARSLASAEDFLADGAIDRTDCLILDVAMPGMSGPELQGELLRLGHAIPIIFITAHSDNAALRKAMERGAFAYLTKPFNEPDLLAAVRAALGESEGAG